MRRTSSLIAAAAAVSLALAPAIAFARAGDSSSMGSRGSRTYSAPAPTNTAPMTAAPMQRSMTPSAPSPMSPGMAPAPAYGGGHSPFMSGLMGGLLGAGIGGLLFGGGLFHGISGFGGFLGFLVQIFLLVLLVRFLFRLFTRNTQQPAFAGPSLLARGGPQDGPPRMGGGSAAPQPGVAILPADYQAFEQLLQAVQAAWSNHDLATLRALSTPEMASYFAEQLAEQTSRGVRNVVSDVRLDQGDLAESWAEGGREYATVAMRFSMIDVTRDATGRVVEGNPVQRTAGTEIWTFLRSGGGRWILSAIQQTQ